MKGGVQVFSVGWMTVQFIQRRKPRYEEVLGQVKGFRYINYEM